MGGKKITLETGCPEAAQAQGWRYGVSVSGHSCANNSSTEGPQALWPLIHRGDSLWNALRTLHVTILPDAFSFGTMWRMGERAVPEPYRKSLSWFAIETAPVQHLWAACTEQSSSQHLRSRFPQPKASRKKGFLQQPYPPLSSLSPSLWPGWRKSWSCSEQASGKDTVTVCFAGTAGCAQSWFQFHHQPSCSWCKSHCQAGEEGGIPATGLSSQTLLFANMETNPRWHALLLSPGSVSRISEVNVKLT